MEVYDGRRWDWAEESVVGSISCPLDIKAESGFAFEVTKLHHSYLSTVIENPANNSDNTVVEAHCPPYLYIKQKALE